MIYVIAFLDTLVLNFFLTMAVSKRARFAFTGWLDRREEKRGGS